MPNVLIGGTQSSGTTLLLSLLHNLGGDTGYTDRHINDMLLGGESYQSGKGLEYIREFESPKYKITVPETLPQIVKEACWITDTDRQRNVIRHGNDDTTHILICIRNFDSTVKSVRNFLAMKERGKSTVQVSDEILRDSHKLILNTASKLPTAMVVLFEFPRFAVDYLYLEEKLQGITQYLDPDKLNLLKQIHFKTVRKDKIHY